jgi:uncharacterized OsmC-like protein
MAVSITVDYTGGLRCSATHGPSKNTLITDAPVDNHGKGESFSPTDLVATALATCMATVIGIKAQQKNLDVTGMKVSVEKHMSEDSPRRIVRLHHRDPTRGRSSRTQTARSHRTRLPRASQCPR